jgi:lipopolysaccharide transport system ATP-binding protein
MTRAVAITCQGVSKSFALVDHGNAWRLACGARAGLPIFEALKNVSFEVPKGQFVGVLGRNGAGKSTLLRTIGGVYAADEGRISVTGALTGLYERGLVGNPQLTGREYARRLLTINGFSGVEREIMVRDIHEFSELGERFDDPVFTYSAGMTARLFFSTATAGEYDVYLLDEILSVGDQHFQAKCWRRLRDRVSTGASGVLVTHDWTAIIRMCETAHILDRGMIAFSGPAEHAARMYLFGESGREPREIGIAEFCARPDDPITAFQGQDFTLRVRARILQRAMVGVVAVIEHLQPGFGWETMLMSRRPQWIGSHPGEYDIEIAIPGLPLECGSYHLNVHLVMPHPTIGSRRVILDGFSWLNGDGLLLEVDSESQSTGFALPATWQVIAL